MIISNIGFTVFGVSKGILKGIHKSHPMTVVRLGIVAFAWVPKKSSEVYWRVVSDTVKDPEYLVKNEPRVLEAITEGHAMAKRISTEIYSKENENLIAELHALREKHRVALSDLSKLKSAFKILKEEEWKSEED